MNGSVVIHCALYFVIFSYNATAVLDFLWACLHIPKIWQGRDKKLPKVRRYLYFAYFVQQNKIVFLSVYLNNSNENGCQPLYVWG